MKLAYFLDLYYPFHDTQVKSIYSKILPKKGVDVTIIARSRNISRIEKRKLDQANLVLLPSRTKYISDFKHIGFLKRLARRSDIVQVRNDPFFGLILKDTRFYYQITHLKGEELFREWRLAPANIFKGIIDLEVRRYLIQRAVLVLSISTIMKRYLKKRYGAGNMMELPMGVDSTATDRKPSGHIKDITDKKIVFVYAGTMSKIRQLQKVIDGFQMANTDHDKVLLMLGGQPASDFRELRRYAKHTDGVYFLGDLASEDVFACMRASDVGLSIIPLNRVYRCSSPTKLFEYFNEGIPVIATAIPEQVWAIRQSRAGLLCRFERKDIAHKMNLIIELDTDEMGRSARSWVQKNRTYKQIAKRIIHLYEK